MHRLRHGEQPSVRTEGPEVEVVVGVGLVVVVVVEVGVEVEEEVVVGVEVVMTAKVYDMRWWLKPLTWYRVSRVGIRGVRWAHSPNQRQAVLDAYRLEIGVNYLVQAFRYKYDSHGEGPLDDWIFDDELRVVLPEAPIYQEALDAYARRI
jgi:hypothetical protein